jgi:ATP-binding cassette subfamily F protein uup
VFGNFSQKGLVFKDNVRVIEYVKSFAEHFPLADGSYLSAAQFLELFLFSPDKQFTYLNNLSGGEKKRLQLLVVLFRNPNFLILDEPTNDLDLPTLGVLEQFLQTYPGCVLLVSHDRYFMDRIVDHLFVLEGQGEVRDFPGNYTQYRLQLKTEEQAQKAVSLAPPPKDLVSAPKGKPIGFKEKREWDLLEKEIPKLEATKQDLEGQLSSGTLDYASIQTISAQLMTVTAQLEAKEMRWLELSELIGN